MTARAAGLAALLAVAACARPVSGPPEIVYGRQACSVCGMIVSEARFASGLRDASGDTVAFDDLGEFLDAARKDPALAPKAYVHDLETEAWLPARDAFFVRVPGWSTPMGSGIAAFADAARAGKFLRSKGVETKPLGLDAALSQWARAPGS